ncbi:ABC transporter ATP-binding protein [Wenxinia marina]|uniref:Amino acid/amide ABC transporter ATP-binding protein 1, HAAT family n=1 Tax=Wenxinia marina DSM 24838 TaxID=1123501 RepID=A0A0D0Q7H5_9RHOB|nr:ATP-binding cassette domain-containing protein [Wenxinia marina]KIQ70399.1 amino acid/amide ABC transporter ATP-binding protein 1, HAAT family [Wenxinia marina DSM 24838]GGL53481.1 ABC transporter ATP-binding protein [Wenxinia marina]
MAEPVLSVRGLTKRFGALVASEDVSLDLAPGEIHAVIGPNGAGKSTLIGQVCGTIPPDAGTVRLAGRDVTADGAAARARAGLARTFQVSALAMEQTVLQNAVLGAIGAAGRPWRLWRPALSDRDAVATAEAALTRVGLSDHAASRVADLSHGQRRQLEVAVALTLAPKAFVMDEPMAGLGADGSRGMTALLADLKHEAPILLVEHDMDAVFALADRISVLVQGRVIATGTVAEIRANAEVRAAYLGEDA